MGKDRTIHSFFKRKRDEVEVVNATIGSTSAPTSIPQPSFSNLEQQEPDRPQVAEQILFRGIEFLERDPGLRPQIWEYPVNQRDEVRCAYLKLGPMQPKLKKYSSSEDGDYHHFQYDWFSLFPSWLEYSQSTGCAYCFFCYLFNNNLKKHSGFDAFTVKGFGKWRRVKDEKKYAFLTHIGSDPCSDHNNAARSCQALLNQSGHLENVIRVRHTKEIERNRLRLKATIASVRWLSFQACVFRGHDESPRSRNRGNFLQMIKLLAEFNPEVAKVVLENAPCNSKYTSPDIQKEILSIYATKVRKHIRDEIGDSKFTIIVDEICDVAKREQMALIFRFVDKDGVLQERFFDLIHVKNTKASTLKEELRFILSKHSFDIQNLRGQGYDGGSNMRGELNGLQALFLQDCPYAYYVNCYAHCLQLALVAAAKDVIPVFQFFENLIYIINAVDNSAKRRDELHSAQVVELAQMIAIDELQTGQGANQICTLKRAGDTRWGSHLGSVSNLMIMFNAVKSVLVKVGKDASAGSVRGEVDIAFKHLMDFEFVFVLCLMKEVLEIADMLNQALQKKS